MTFQVRLVGLVAGLTAVIVSSGAVAADGDAQRGQKIFFGTGQCKVCHSVKRDEKRVGPSLFGVVGRKCGTAAKQRFSSNYKAACEKTGFVWEEKSLVDYIEDPTAFISQLSGETKRSPMPKRAMSEQDRADIVAYLKTLK